jgi:hypothetical protein
MKFSSVLVAVILSMVAGSGITVAQMHGGRQGHMSASASTAKHDSSMMSGMSCCCARGHRQSGMKGGMMGGMSQQEVGSMHQGMSDSTMSGMSMMNCGSMKQPNSGCAAKDQSGMTSPCCKEMKCPGASDGRPNLK